MFMLLFLHGAAHSLLQLQVDNVDVSAYPTERVRSLIVGKASLCPTVCLLALK
jgi:hypothetical protein